MKIRCLFISIAVGLVLTLAILWSLSLISARGVYADQTVSGNLAGSHTWSNGEIITITGDLTVTGNLIVEPNVTVNVFSQTTIVISGTMMVNGTTTQPVTFTSISASPACGDWEGLLFQAGSSGQITHTLLEYGRFGVVVDTASTDVLSSTVRFMCDPVNFITGEDFYADAAYGFYLTGTTSSVIQANTVYSISGGDAIGDGGSGAGGGAGVGIFVGPNAAPVIQANQIMTVTGGNGGFPASESGGGGGAATGIYLFKANSATVVQNNRIINIKGGQGNEGVIGSGGGGGGATGIYIHQTTITTPLQRNTVSEIVGGQAGTGTSLIGGGGGGAGGGGGGGAGGMVFEAGGGGGFGGDGIGGGGGSGGDCCGSGIDGSEGGGAGGDPNKGGGGGYGGVKNGGGGIGGGGSTTGPDGGGGQAAGLASNISTFTATNNLIYDITGGASGGSNAGGGSSTGLFAIDGSVIYLHNTVARVNDGGSGNPAGISRGVWLTGTVVATVTNNIISRTVPGTTIGVDVNGSAILTLTHNNILTHATQYRVNEVTLPLPTTNIAQDPQFVNGDRDDFHIKAGSPAVDSGTPVAVALDIDGDKRPQGSGFDMGADEYLQEGRTYNFLPIIVKED